MSKNETIEVCYELHVQGTIEVEPLEVDGMTDDEIWVYIYEGAEMDIAQGPGYRYSIILHGVDAAIRCARAKLADDE